MKFIRKALWPTAIVAAALMLFGALGSAINAERLGDVQSSSGDVVEAGEEVAIYVVVEGTPDPATATKAAAVDAIDALANADSPRAIITADADLRTALIAAGVVEDPAADTVVILEDAATEINTLRTNVIAVVNTATDAPALVTALEAIDTAVADLKGRIGAVAGAVDNDEVYTVEVDGNAEIIQVLLAERIVTADPEWRSRGYNLWRPQARGSAQRTD